MIFYPCPTFVLKSEFRYLMEKLNDLTKQNHFHKIFNDPNGLTPPIFFDL